MSPPDQPREPTKPLERVQYYAIAGRGRTRDNPSGVARRRFTPEGSIDETFRRDQTWVRNSVLIKWEDGEMGSDFYEISETEAEEIIERFRTRWAAADQEP